MGCGIRYRKLTAKLIQSAKTGEMDSHDGLVAVPSLSTVQPDDKSNIYCNVFVFRRDVYIFILFTFYIIYLYT